MRSPSKELADPISHAGVPRCFPWSSLPRCPARADKRNATVHDQDMAGDVTGLVRQQEAHGPTDIPAGTLALEYGSLAADVTRLFGTTATASVGACLRPRRCEWRKRTISATRR
jgi:hypothetical protein